MTKEEILNKSDTEILAIARQLRVAYGLKRTLRYATKRDENEHSESVAEHVFALMFLAEFFLPLEEANESFDVRKLHQILLFHDFGEIKHGDLPYHWKTEEDKKKEIEAAVEIFQSLPASMREESFARWSEYEKRESDEARFAYALDKVEPLFELMDPVNEQSMKRLKFSYEDHIGVKRRATEAFPVMRKFVEVITHSMVNREVFWKNAM